MTHTQTTTGTDAAGRPFTAYGSASGWGAVAAEDANGWWRIWLVPPDKGEPRRPLWGLCQWSEGYARGVAEHIARALAVVAQADPDPATEAEEG